MLILASQSPRRQELLQLLGVTFTIKTADIDETMDMAYTPQHEVRQVAARKAAKIAESADPGDVIISADTIVVIGGEILGKPKDKADAHRMLRLLAGQTHEVMTGLCVRQGERVKDDVVITRVTFRPLSDEEIDAYIATGDPMDKAGAYGVQGRAATFVSSLDGDFFSVMGLPVCRLTEMLREFDVKILGVSSPKGHAYEK